MPGPRGVQKGGPEGVPTPRGVKMGVSAGGVDCRGLGGVPKPKSWVWGVGGVFSRFGGSKVGVKPSLRDLGKRKFSRDSVRLHRAKR